MALDCQFFESRAHLSLAPLHDEQLARLLVEPAVKIHILLPEVVEFYAVYFEHILVLLQFLGQHLFVLAEFRYLQIRLASFLLQRRLQVLDDLLGLSEEHFVRDVHLLQFLVV